MIRRKLLVVTMLAIAVLLTQGYGIAQAGSLVWTLAKNKVYGVEIIAHQTCPAGSFTGSNRRSIAVKADFTSGISPGAVTITLPTDKTNLIYLVPGDDFQVLDGNACDTVNNGAKLQMPPNASSQYSVWVRLVGKPFSGISAFPCAEATFVDSTGATVTELICGGAFVKTRLKGHGEPSFTNATNDLLFITNKALTDICGSTTVGIFDPCLADFFWVWDTTGRPHAQVWFVQQ